MQMQGVDFVVGPWEVCEQTEPTAKNNCYHETVFCTGNGLVGVRGVLEEGFPDAESQLANQGSSHVSNRATYINGFHDVRRLQYAHSDYCYGCPQRDCVMIPVQEATRIQLFVKKEGFNLASGKVNHHVRSLNMAEGSMSRRVVWQTNTGDEFEIKSTRFASFCRPHVVVMRYSVSPMRLSTGSVDIALRSFLEPPPQRDGFSMLHRTKSFDPDGDIPLAAMTARTAASQIDVSCAVAHSCVFTSGEPVGKPSFSYVGGSICTEYTTSLEVGDTVELTKIVAYATSTEVAMDTEDAAKEECLEACAEGFGILQLKQRKFLDEYWADADVEIKSKAQTQSALRFNLLHLLMSAGRLPRTNFAAKGLTGEFFCGQYSWDSEIFIFPFFVFHHPPVAKAMIQYRIMTLPEAKDRALDLALPRGALYPFRTIDGTESAASTACTMQLHMNADIAFAIKLYLEVTNDVSTLLKGGAEVVLSTALVWILWGVWDRGEFHLRNVTGPDEYNVLENDNLYTNLMAREHLYYACSVAKKLQSDHPAEWQTLSSSLQLSLKDLNDMFDAAENMALPYDSKQHIHLQHESFKEKKKLTAKPSNSNYMEGLHPLTVYRHQVCKMAEIVHLQVLLGDKFTLDDKRANFDFYEELTTKDSSLSPSIFSTMASELGDYPKAYRYFEQTLYVDLENRVGNTGDGIHAACMAGSWACVVKGFAGMRTYRGVLYFSPFLPEEWEEYSFAVNYQCARISVRVGRRFATYTAGHPIWIVHGMTKVHLSPGKSAVVPLHAEIRTLDFDAVVFDLDSIVENVENTHFMAWKLILSNFFQKCEGDESRAELTKEQYLAYIRHSPYFGPHAGLQRLLKERGIRIELGKETDALSINPPTVCSLANLKAQKFQEMIKLRGVRLLPSAKDIVVDLRKSGVLVGCASASRAGGFMHRNLSEKDAISFDYFVDASIVDLDWKPEAQFFVHCVEKLCVPLNRTIVVIDSVAGFSKSALKKFCAVASTNSDNNDEEDVRRNGVDWVIPSWKGVSTDAFDLIAQKKGRQ